MKKIIIFSLLAVFIFSPLNAFAEKITVVADEWCPYNCAPGEKPGFMIEIAQAVFKKNNIEVDYSIMPWSRAVELTRQGQYSAIVGSTNGDAPDFVFPEKSQGLSTTAFFGLSDSKWEYKGEQSLPEVVIGVIDDYSYSSVVDEYIKKNLNNRDRIQVIGGENALELNIKKLEAKRIDAFPEDVNVLTDYYTSRGQTVPLKNLGEASSKTDLKDKELFLAFSPKNPESKRYASMLSAGTDELRKSGELKKILDKYGVSDWSENNKKK